VNLPQVTMLAALPPAIPEIPIAKRRNQRGVAKIAVFAYHRETGEPAWQSGIATDESSANDIWVLGAGPFKKGTIYNGTTLAGQLTTQHDDEEDPRHEPVARVADAAVYDQDLMRNGRVRPSESQVQHATAIEEVYPLVEPKVL